MLRRLDSAVSPARSWARRSALMRCLVIDCELAAGGIGKKLQAFRRERTCVADTLAHADPMRLWDSRRAVDAFFRMLPGMSGHPPERIGFAVDAIRSEMYDLRKVEAMPQAFCAASGADDEHQTREDHVRSM